MTPSTPTAPIRRAVVVLGMHRSGTSLVAGCLQRLGVDFGPRLMPPDADNPRGYFEHNDVVNLHDRLLLALDRSWDETSPFPPEWWRNADLLDPYRQQLLDLLRRDFPTAQLWGLKDPRLCRLLPWWEPLWAETGSTPLFVLVGRRPGEVAASLARREKMSTPKANFLWLRHALEAERWTRGYDRILVNFGDFLADEKDALASVRHALGLRGEGTVLAPLVDASLGRSGIEDPPGDLPAWVQRADAAIQAGQRGDEIGMRSELDEISRQLSTEEIFLIRTPAEETTDLGRQLAMIRRQARWYEAEWQKARARAEVLLGRLEAIKATKRG